MTPCTFMQPQRLLPVLARVLSRPAMSHRGAKDQDSAARPSRPAKLRSSPSTKVAWVDPLRDNASWRKVRDVNKCAL